MSSRKKAAGCYPAQAIHATGTLTERIASTAFRATLPNGKTTIAYMQRRTAERLGALQPGQVVSLVLSPADLETARITDFAPL